MSKRILLAMLPVLLAGAGPARGDTPQPAPTTPAELIAASRHAFDNRYYARADSLAEAACARLEIEGRSDPLEHATALVCLSRARTARRSLADSVAVHSARRALAMLPTGASDRDLVRADAHDVLSLILDEQNRADLALDHARRALALRRAGYGEIHEEVAESWYRLGSAQMSLGQVDSALVTMRTGLETRLGCNIESDRRIGDFHTEIAELLEKQGDPDAARAELDIALREYETRKGRTHSAMVQGLQRTGLFEMRNGDLARAVDLSLQALTVAESVKNFSPANLALLRGNLAVMLNEMGDFTRAYRLLGQVVPVYQAELGMDHRQTLWAEVALATTEASLGDTVAAATRFRSVCRRFEAAGSITTTGSLTQARVGLAELVADEDPRAALALIDAAEAVERTRPDPNWGAMADVQLIRMRLLADLGDRAGVARADTALARTLEEHDLHGTDTGIGALAAGSLALAKVGRTKEAVARARTGAGLSRDRMMRDLRALPDREGLTLAGERSASLDALLSLALAGHGDPAVAWDALIRWRGLVRDEVMRRRLPAVALGDTAALRAHAAWMAATRRLAQFEVRTAGAADDATLARLAELRARADDAERRWAVVAPRTLAQTGSGAGDVSFEAVKSALPSGSALVAFTTVRTRGQPDHLAAFVLDRQGRVRVRDLGAASGLEAALSQWRSLAGRSPKGQAGAEQACREAGRRLRELTWDVIAPLTGNAEDVVVVADGPLHRMAWAALPVGDEAYLVERGPGLTVLESERDLLRAAEPTPASGLLAVGGVDFAGAAGTSPAAAPAAPRPLALASTRAMLPDCRSGLAPVFAELPGTVREIEAIAREQGTDVQVLRGGAATEAAFKRLAPGRRVIHLATHAVALDDLCTAGIAEGERGVGGVAPVVEARARPVAAETPRSPWLGRRVVLALAGANAAGDSDDENEGLLTANEVATLDLRGTEWVVLSACESGVAENWNREGVLGLTRAFRLAGARAVIASQWAVDDDATSEWMSALHRARVRGASGTGRAMQEASREILRARRADGRGTHPFYWAAFTATGE
jgi:CHAT domain-containing protein/tetratricopeptide (TPR) repeat protein